MGIVADNFAGGGGASLGISRALGRHPDVAINHDEMALAMYAANHPNTKLYCQSIFSVDPVDIAAGREVDLAWFSPDCTHYSRARGGKPKRQHIRDLPWVVHMWAQRVKPRLMFVENVEEILGWGPLDDDGRAVQKRKGETFRKWVAAIRREGYKVQWKVLRGDDYGAPTIRKRLFLVARCDGLPIVWPKPTHGRDVASLPPVKTAASHVIDFSLYCPSIFTRKKPLAENTQRRIARGLKKFVFDAEEPFIIPVGYGEREGQVPRVNSVNEPLGTVVASGVKHGLVVPYVQHIQHASNKNGTMPIDEPLRTVTAQPKGGGMALVSAFLAKHFGGVTGVDIRTPFPTVTTRGTQNMIVTAHLDRQFGMGCGSAADEPVPTVMPGGAGKTSLVTSHLTKFYGTCNHGQSVNEPMPTVTSSGTHIGEVRTELTRIPEVRAFLMKYYGEGGQLQDLREPLHTVPTKERFGLVTVEGEDYQITDIGMRMLSARELFRAQGFPDEYIIDPIYNGKPLIKTEQIKMCGNSVVCQVAEAVVRANYYAADDVRSVAA